MSEEAIKRRLGRAKERARDLLRSAGYQIIGANDKIFSLIGIRRSEIRMIKVTIDKTASREIDLIKSIIIPENCSKEIWCRAHGEQDFQVVVIENNDEPFSYIPMHKKVTQNKKSPLKQKTKEYYLEKYNWTCQSCGGKAKNEKLHIHHVKPLHKGGDNSEGNLTLLCEECHKNIHFC